jgi:hypothetical protein
MQLVKQGVVETDRRTVSGTMDGWRSTWGVILGVER